MREEIVFAKAGDLELLIVPLDDPDMEARIFALRKRGRTIGRFAAVPNAWRAMGRLILEGEEDV